MEAVVFILKEVPSTMSICDFGPGGLYDPKWCMRWGRMKGTHLRFTGLKGKLGYMEVLCHDKRCPELCGCHMVWKVDIDCHELMRFWRTSWSPVKTMSQKSAVSYDESGKDLLIIRLRFYWVMRGIVGFKRLIARIRIRRKTQGNCSFKQPIGETPNVSYLASLAQLIRQ